jgi:cell wall-associated NlpC family hydrolase
VSVGREDIIACARGWVDTPFRHQAQRKGVGCDCKGLIVGVAAELGLPEAQSLAALDRVYSASFSGRRMYDGLAATLTRVAEALPGDLLAILIARDPYPRHLAFLTERETIIHSYGAGVGRVAEVPRGHWRVHTAWTWPSLEAAA